MSGCNTQGGGQGSQGNLSRGRGRSGRHDSNTSQSKGIIKKNLQDYQYYLGSAKQASDNEATTSHFINQIKKTYAYGNDIATALGQFIPIQANIAVKSEQVRGCQSFRK